MEQQKAKNNSFQGDFTCIEYDEYRDTENTIPKTRETQQIYDQYKQKLRKNKKFAKQKYYTMDDIKDLSPEDKQFIILDKDTGQYFDIRNDEEELSQSMALINDTIDKDEGDDETIWKDFWEKKQKASDAIIEAAENGDGQKLIDTLAYANSHQIPLDLNYKVWDEHTALHFAATEGHFETTKILLDYKANIESQTIFLRTPLHLATIRGSFDLVKYLLQRGANINCTDRNKYTPIHYACENYSNEIVDLLLSQGADVNVKTLQGLTVIELAQNQGNMWEIFEKHGHKKIEPYNFERKQFIEKILHQKQYERQTKTNSLEVQAKVGYEDFNVYSVLGKGAFGKVYLVKKKRGNEEYLAMKVLEKSKIQQNNLVRYAKIEKNVMQIMQHPFIVNLHSAFQTSTGLFLVMQYCPGGDLSDLLDQKEKFDEQTAKIYLAEVLLALEALHRNNIIFRDLKPANILLDDEGHCRLADFGLANHKTEKQEFDKLRQSFLGTPAYLAPEMVRKSGHNRMIDWYLLGVLLYEFLTGVTPYYANTKDQLFQNILKGPLRMPNKGITDSAKDLIVKLLNRNPKKRLGYERDGDEIKEHPFFDGIDWEKLFDRKYPVERPLKKEMPTKILDIDVSATSGQRVLQVDDWSFVQRGEKGQIPLTKKSSSQQYVQY